MPAGAATGPPGGGSRPLLRSFRSPAPWKVPLLFLVLLVAFGAGIWGSYRAVYPVKGLHRITGIFEARWGEAMILVRHDAVPGLMDEMSSMAFFAESKELLDRAALKPGDRVRFTIKQLPDKLLVVRLQKLNERPPSSRSRSAGRVYRFERERK